MFFSATADKSSLMAGAMHTGGGAALTAFLACLSPDFSVIYYWEVIL